MCLSLFASYIVTCVYVCALEQHQLIIETDEASNQPVCRRLVLEFSDDEKTNAVVEVNKKLVQQLKPHQAEGQRPHTVITTN